MNARVFGLAGALAVMDGRVAEAITLLEEGRARGLAGALGSRTIDLSHLSADDRSTYQEAVRRVQQIEASSRIADDPMTLLEQARVADQRLKQIIGRISSIRRTSYPSLTSRYHNYPMVSSRARRSST